MCAPPGIALKARAPHGKKLRPVCVMCHEEVSDRRPRKEPFHQKNVGSWLPSLCCWSLGVSPMEPSGGRPGGWFCTRRLHASLLLRRGAPPPRWTQTGCEDATDTSVTVHLEEILCKSCKGQIFSPWRELAHVALFITVSHPRVALVGGAQRYLLINRKN